MSLTVETGSGAADADSLVTLAEVRAFASGRGKTLPADDTELEALIRNAHDYLLAIESKLQGYRAVEDQALPFPRVGVWLYGKEVDKDAIPNQLKNAISQLVIDVQTYDPLIATGSTRLVIEEQVGPIKTKYSESGGLTPTTLPRVEALLEPFLIHGWTSLISVRI